MHSDHFAARELLAGVWHIRDEMGVCMTLLCGQEHALLVDTGYGVSDVQAFVRTLTDKPLTVLLTHAHHDHALGARWFDRTLMFPQDLPDFALYTGDAFRRRVADQAAAKGVRLPEDFLTAPIAQPAALTEGDIPLGGMTARILCVPGHTPGSAVVYVPERELLLTGDDWTPCTWLFFPAALDVRTYRDHLRGLLRLPFRHVICSHQHQLFDRSMPDDFAAALTDGVLSAARKVDVGYPQDTREARLPHDQILVFDWNKYIKEA